MFRNIIFVCILSAVSFSVGAEDKQQQDKALVFSVENTSAVQQLAKNEMRVITGNRYSATLWRGVPYYFLFPGIF